MDSQIFTPFHVAISLIGILSGLIVAYGLITDQRMPFEPPFAIAQGVALLLFIVIGFMAFRRFRPVIFT
jgi:hypothetical protein